MGFMDTEWDKLSEEQKNAVLKDQKDRCEETCHEWENCCSIFLEIYQRCKWCGETK